LYAWPLPLETFPIPSFFPHNPLSLLRIVCTYISQAVFPPSSQPSVKYQAYFSEDTSSVHVTDSNTTRALWEKGFFGKGTLSRSEPTWLDGEKRRRGILAKATSEEITNKRRNERKQFKLERARKEREIIEQRLIDEGKIHVFQYSKEDLDEEASKIDNKHQGLEVSTNRSGSALLESTSKFSTNVMDTERMNKETFDGNEPHNLASSQEARQPLGYQDYKTNSESSPAVLTQEEDDTVDTIVDQEHLQLTMEEAFFLSYGLGVLQVSRQGQRTPIGLDTLLESFRMQSYFPPAKKQGLKPDDPFLISYVVYHHFRSLGWVVRPGIKFAVDYLLYNRGPVFSHAEFAIIILPSYSHQYYRETEEGQESFLKKATKSWSWLHCVNRVQSQVRKSLVLVYVEIPPPDDYISRTAGSEQRDTEDGKHVANIGHLLQRYKVREIGLKRWLPNRSKE
jgi:tRNA-splicing endonuclease subunit Sen2